MFSLAVLIAVSTVLGRAAVVFDAVPVSDLLTQPIRLNLATPAADGSASDAPSAPIGVHFTKNGTANTSPLVSPLYVNDTQGTEVLRDYYFTLSLKEYADPRDDGTSTPPKLDRAQRLRRSGFVITLWHNATTAEVDSNGAAALAGPVQVLQMATVSPFAEIPKVSETRVVQKEGKKTPVTVQRKAFMDDFSFLPADVAEVFGGGGVVSQAERFEATGACRADGVFSSEPAVWNVLTGATGAELVHGTFRLTFLNHQELTLSLTPLEAPAVAVVAYGFAVRSVAETTSLSSLLGIPQPSVHDSLFNRAPAQHNASDASEGGFMQTLVSAVALAAYPITAVIDTSAMVSANSVDTRARSFLEALDSLWTWLRQNWPVMIAASSVFFIKLFTDHIQRRSDQKRILAQRLAQQRAAGEAPKAPASVAARKK